MRAAVSEVHCPLPSLFQLLQFSSLQLLDWGLHFLAAGQLQTFTTPTSLACEPFNNIAFCLFKASKCNIFSFESFLPLVKAPWLSQTYQEWHSFGSCDPIKRISFVHIFSNNSNLPTELSELCFGFWPQGIWYLSSLTRDWIYTLCMGRQSLNHWTTREDPLDHFFNWYYNSWITCTKSFLLKNFMY